MAKNKISEFSSTPANNTDISGINISEGCAPSGINNAIRELMSQLKDQQTGADGDDFTVGGNLTVTGTSAFTGVATFTAAPVVPTTFGVVPSGGIIMWSGTIATIPSGWLLCDGSSGTPDLRNRFIIGANADSGGSAKTNITGSATQTGGSKDAIVVSHSHTASTTATDSGHTHGVPESTFLQNSGNGFATGVTATSRNVTSQTGFANISASTTVNSSGSSGTNANLVPYYALAFIMKS